MLAGGHIKVDPGMIEKNIDRKYVMQMHVGIDND